jgi:hypothetical protein
MPAVIYDPKSRGAAAYGALADEMLARERMMASTTGENP